MAGVAKRARWRLEYAGLYLLFVIGRLLPRRPLLRIGRGAGPGFKRSSVAPWIALAACASVLLLATTSQLTQEVAVIPFLWVLPLIIYLLTFILCFDSDRWYSRTKFTVAFVITSILYCYVLAVGARLAIPVQIGAYSLVLFVGCMICHGELTHLKPHPRYLTLFYFMVSVMH